MENGFLNPGKASEAAFMAPWAYTSSRKFSKAALVMLYHGRPWVILRATHWLGKSIRPCLTGHILEGPFKVVDGE